MKHTNEFYRRLREEFKDKGGNPVITHCVIHSDNTFIIQGRIAPGIFIDPFSEPDTAPEIEDRSKRVAPIVEIEVKPHVMPSSEKIHMDEHGRFYRRVPKGSGYVHEIVDPLPDDIEIRYEGRVMCPDPMTNVELGYDGHGRPTHVAIVAPKPKPALKVGVRVYIKWYDPEAGYEKTGYGMIREVGCGRNKDLFIVEIVDSKDFIPGNLLYFQKEPLIDARL